MCSHFSHGIRRVRMREGSPWNILCVFAKGFLSPLQRAWLFLLLSTGAQPLRMPLDNGQSSGTEAYVFLLCWKKTFAAQKCDLLHDKWDRGGSEFSTLLSDAQAEPALGMHSRTWVSEQVASIKGQKEQRWASVSEGGSHFLPSEPSERKGTVGSQHGNTGLRRTCCN